MDDDKTDGTDEQNDGQEHEGQEPERDDEPFDAERAKAKIRKVNGEAENLRRRLKELEPLAREAEERRQAAKSDTEKATEAVTAATKRAEAAEAALMRMEVAIAKGLTPGQAKRLVGDSKEALEADADDLLKEFGAQERTPLPRKPHERLRGGGTSGEPVEETDPAKLAARVRRI